MQLRLFIAIELGEEEKKSLRLLQGRLKRALPAVRWVKPESIHLTVKFLGDTEERFIPEIRHALDIAAAECGRFSLSIGRVGAFPNVRSPRVIWVGVSEPAGELAKLAARLDALLARLGVETEERGYTPHLTLGRVRERGGGGVFAHALPLFENASCGGMEPAAIALIRSDLIPDGPIYTVLHLARLGGGTDSGL